MTDSKPHSDLPIERAKRGLRAAREFFDHPPLASQPSRAGDRDYIRNELIPDALVALDSLEEQHAAVTQERDELILAADHWRRFCMDAETRERELKEQVEVLRGSLEAMLPGTLASELEYETNAAYHACAYIAKKALETTSIPASRSSE